MGHLMQGHRTLLCAPTGSGKTIMFAYLASKMMQAGKRIYILVHRAELLEQVSRTLTDMEVKHGCIAPSYPNHANRPVQVASVFTLARRLADYRAPDLVIIDEAHHAIPRTTWGRTLQAYRQSARLGVTATPERLGGEGLADTFDTLLVGPTVRELIDQGSLCDYRLFAPPVTYTEGVHRRMGDYDKKELSQAADTPTITGCAVTHYEKLSRGKRAIVFCVSVQHADHTADAFKASGYAARRIDGKCSVWERRSLIHDFAQGRIQILTSCDLISEGFDLPAIEVAILLRPTQSLALHLQQVGRALRPYDGKSHAIILDHAGNTHRHGLPDDPRDWSLDGKEFRQASESDGPSVSVRTCGQCFAAVRSPAPVCQYCRYVFPLKPREVEEVDGTLEEVDQAIVRQQQRREVGRAKDLDALIALGKQRGYKPAWAHFVYKARMQKKRPVVETLYARG
jgi:DNA repair protein RadD